MRNIYLEVGVVDLTKVTIFYDTHRGKSWQFELFEPNHWNNERIDALIKKSSFTKTNTKRCCRRKQKNLNINTSSIHLHPVAATSEDGKRRFYYSTGYGLGSSFFLGKSRVSANRYMEVDCIDFNKWIIDNLNQDDYIHLSMDAEGSEYEILPHMIKEGSIFYINSMEVEFHHRKFRGENADKFYDIHEELKAFFRTFEAEKIFWKF